jgi:undecaprenyl-diphosphatase
MLAVERWLRGRPLRVEITWTVAVVIGLAQVVAALLPGTSRSGATILAALCFGLQRPLATEFTFLLGVPTLLAAGGLEIASAFRSGEASGENWMLLGLGTAVAIATAFVAVKWLLKYVQTHTFELFGWYRILLAGAILGWWFT